MALGVVLRADDGIALPLDPARWHAEASSEETTMLAGLKGPVLDVGCGPGRLVLALARLGVAALGVDPAIGAVEVAQRRGAAVLPRSVFDPLPGQGRWGTVLLADGNIGIGGNPLRLLRRCRELLNPSGTVVVELEPPGTAWRHHRARLEDGAHHGPWFSWAVVGVDGIDMLAAASGLVVRSVQESAGASRWFAALVLENGLSCAVA